MKTYTVTKAVQYLMDHFTIEDIEREIRMIHRNGARDKELLNMFVQALSIKLQQLEK